MSDFYAILFNLFLDYPNLTKIAFALAGAGWYSGREYFEIVRERSIDVHCVDVDNPRPTFPPLPKTENLLPVAHRTGKNAQNA